MYKMFSDIYTDENGSSHKGYGIALYEEDGSLKLSVDDITDNEEDISEFVVTLNKYRPALVHLPDVILDFINR